MTHELANIAWVPCNPELSNNKLFDISASRDCALERFVIANKMLRDNGFASNTIDLCDLSKVDLVVFYSVSLDIKWLLKAVKCNPQMMFINVPIEPSTIAPFHENKILSAMPFERIMVWSDSLVAQGLPFVKANTGEFLIREESIPDVSFDNKGFLVTIYSNKIISHKNSLYEERIKAFDYFFDKNEGIDLYGIGWDTSTRESIVKSYKGKCGAKKDVLKNYKFSICFENSKNYPGYITEKIFDCFAAGTIPIYYGAPNVKDYIPETCFIDFRDFSDYDDLNRYLQNMSEHEYQGYLDAVKEFLHTPDYYEFTSCRFGEILYEQIQILMNEPRKKRTMLGFKWSLFKLVLENPLHFLKEFKKCRRFLFDLGIMW